MPVSHLTSSVAEMLASALNTVTEGSYSHLTTSEAEMLALLVSEMTGQSYSHLTTSVETLWELLLTQAASDGITFNRSTQSNEEIAAIIANGVTAPGGGEEYEGPLDLYSTGIVAAFSLRAMTSGSTADAVKIRRSSDDTEQTFALTDNAVDPAAVAVFVDGGDGFASEWKDHSGNGYHVLAATNDDQPQFSASVTGGKPGLLSRVTLVSTLASVAADVTIASGAVTFFAVAKGVTYTQFQPGDTPHIGTGASAYNYLVDGGGNSAGAGYDGLVDNTTFYLIDTAFEFGTNNYRKNGVTLTPGASYDNAGAPEAVQGTLRLQVYPDDLEMGGLCEVLLYDGLLNDATRLAIRQNIAAYYGITL